MVPILLKKWMLNNKTNCSKVERWCQKSAQTKRGCNDSVNNFFWEFIQKK